MNLKCPGQSDTGCCSAKRKEAEVAELSFVLGASPDKRAQTRHLLGNLLHLMMTFHYFHCRDIIPAPVCDRSMCEERWRRRYDVVYVTLGRLWECDPSQTFLACVLFWRTDFSAQSVSVSIESNWRRENCIISIHSAELKIARKNKLYVSEHLTADIISTSSFHSTLLLCAAKKKVKKERRCVWWTYVYTRMSDDDRIDSVHCILYNLYGRAQNYNIK